MTHIGPTNDFSAKRILYYVENFNDFLSLASTCKTMHALSKCDYLNKKLISLHFPGFRRCKRRLRMSYSLYYRFINLLKNYVIYPDSNSNVNKYRSSIISFLSNCPEEINIWYLFSERFLNRIISTQNLATKFRFVWILVELFRIYCEKENIYYISEILCCKNSFSHFGRYLDYFIELRYEIMISVLLRLNKKRIDDVIIHTLKFKMYESKFFDLVCDKIGWRLNDLTQKQLNEIISTSFDNEQYDELYTVFKRYNINLSDVMTNYLLSFNYDDDENKIYMCMMFMTGYNIQLNFDKILSSNNVSTVGYISKACNLLKIPIVTRIPKNT